MRGLEMTPCPCNSYPLNASGHPTAKKHLLLRFVCVISLINMSAQRGDSSKELRKIMLTSGKLLDEFVRIWQIGHASSTRTLLFSSSLRFVR